MCEHKLPLCFSFSCIMSQKFLVYLLKMKIASILVLIAALDNTSYKLCSGELSSGSVVREGMVIYLCVCVSVCICIWYMHMYIGIYFSPDSFSLDAFSKSAWFGFQNHIVQKNTHECCA